MTWLGRLALLVVFGLLAALMSSRQSGPGAAAAIDTPDAVRSFANAWVEGTIRRLDFDPASDPDVREGSGRLIANAMTSMTRDISPYDQDRPIAAFPVGEAQRVAANTGELREDDIIQPVEVTWDLGTGRRWTYRTDVVSRTTLGQTRVMWRPSTVHPALANGLVLRSRRVLAVRAPVLDALDQPVKRTLAPRLIGTTAKADLELAQTYPGRVEPGDLIGVGGLQHQYDAQLAGTAGLEINIVPEGGTQVEPTLSQAHLVPPQPGEPLFLSLDSTWQQRADALLATATQPTAVVAIDALTGSILAAASGGTDTDLALQGRYPPGLALRPAAMLAAMRHASATEPVITMSASTDCSPLILDGQRFTSPTGAPATGALSLLQAYARSCRPGMIRAGQSWSALELSEAAAVLGIGGADTTGARAFSGAAPGSEQRLGRAQNLIGEGQSLASPLSMARMAGAVAVGAAHPSVLVRATEPVAPGASNRDRPVRLNAAEQSLLQTMMRTSFEVDPSLAPLRTRGGAIGALSAAAGYGPATSAPQHGWCVGYRGNIAFAVLVTGSAPDDGRALLAAQLAAALLR